MKKLGILALIVAICVGTVCFSLREDEISDEELAYATSFYISSGMDEEQSKKQATQYLKEREALYQEALAHGYGVTDKEVWAYLEELKAVISTADNKDDVMKAISQFDSEEAYWNYEFQIYQKNLPIQRYMQSLEKGKDR